MKNKNFQKVVTGRPSWIRGAITNIEASYLYSQIINRDNISSVIELGVASGFSTAVILAALKDNKNDYKVLGIDNKKYCYFNEQKNIGEAITDIYENEKLDVKLILTKDLTSKIISQYAPLDLIFIDANHRHPYPILDLLMFLPYLRDGSIIVLHDINLAKNRPEHNENGPHYLFYNLNRGVFKSTSIPNRKGILCNMGSLIVNDLSFIKIDLLKILEDKSTYPWEQKLNERYNQFYEELTK
jgi:predicted O-methyltransferase YrrM